jgi:hypothetical protein
MEIQKIDGFKIMFRGGAGGLINVHMQQMLSRDPEMFTDARKAHDVLKNKFNKFKKDVRSIKKLSKN